MHAFKLRLTLAPLAAAVALSAPSLAHAADAAAEGSVSLSTDDAGGGSDDSGAFLLAGKVGGILSFNNLNPFVHGGIDVGYVFPVLDRGIGLYLGAEYTAPKTDGSVTEEATPERVPEGAYDWELRQKELVFQPTFLYRMTFLSDIVVPYAGIGPRIYLLETTVRGSSGGEQFGDTFERSTKYGFGVPLGAEFVLGPGGIIAELAFQWGPFDHTTTGDVHLGGGSLFVGYRALLF